MGGGESMEEDINEEDRSCMVSTWRCFSGVLEQAVRQSCKPAGLTSLLEEVFYRIAFHGTALTRWSSVMRMPEARQVAHCLSKHDLCAEEKAMHLPLPRLLHWGDDALGNSRYATYHRMSFL